MEFAGYIATIIMGTVLGLVGGGGSILTVPILVYLFQISPVEATGYSLFIVGLSALVGGVQYYKKGEVNVKVGAVFALPAIAAVYAVRRFGVPAIPETMTMLGISFQKDSLIMVVFALMMLVASYSMIKGRKETEGKEKPLNIPLIFLEGIVVGAFTGFVGAGGGFLIIPALVILAGLGMKVAVGTSLMIIAFKSLLGFIGDIQVMAQVNWSMLLVLSALSVGGIFIGSWLSNKIPGKKLKPAFGWFVLAIGSFLIYQQVVA